MDNETNIGHRTKPAFVFVARSSKNAMTISLLAIVEIGAFVFLAFVLRHRYSVIAAATAASAMLPMLLLRSDKSVELGLEWLNNYWNYSREPVASFRDMFYRRDVRLAIAISTVIPFAFYYVLGITTFDADLDWSGGTYALLMIYGAVICSVAISGTASVEGNAGVFSINIISIFCFVSNTLCLLIYDSQLILNIAVGLALVLIFTSLCSLLNNSWTVSSEARQSYRRRDLGRRNCLWGAGKDNVDPAFCSVLLLKRGHREHAQKLVSRHTLHRPNIAA
jgi:hypothetical protein